MTALAAAFALLAAGLYAPALGAGLLAGLNIALHALNATMVSALGGRLGLQGGPAVAAGALFLSFPATVAAVAWPAGGRDVLMTSFVLGFLLVLASPNLTRARAVLGLTLALAASLASATGVVAPVLGGMTCALLRSPRERWILAGISAVLVGVVLIGRFALALPGQEPIHLSRSGLGHLLTQPFAMLAVPLGAPEATALPWLAFVLVAVPVVGLVVAAFRWTRGSAHARRVLWGAAFVPVSVALAGAAFFADADLLGARELYLAAAGWSILLATVLTSGSGSRAALVAPALFAACYVALAGVYVRRWTTAADLRDRILDAASVAIAPHCGSAIVIGVPETYEGVPLFLNGFSEVMRERFRDLRIHTSPGARAECNLEWTGEELMGGIPDGRVSAGAPHRKPAFTYLAIAEFIAPPPTLREMLAEAGLVVLGRFTGARPRDSGEPGKPWLDIFTAWTLEVDEVLQAADNAEIPGEITVVRMGVTRDLGSHIERTEVAEFPEFDLGRRYVLFLQWSRAHDAFVLPWGPFAAFDVDGTHVEPLRQSAYGEQFRGLPTEDFLAALRRQGGGQ